MPNVLTKLEGIAEKLLDAIDEKPLKTIIVTVCMIWLIGKIIKSLK